MIIVPIEAPYKSFLLGHIKGQEIRAIRIWREDLGPSDESGRPEYIMFYGSQNTAKSYIATKSSRSKCIRHMHRLEHEPDSVNVTMYGEAYDRVINPPHKTTALKRNTVRAYKDSDDSPSGSHKSTETVEPIAIKFPIILSNPS